VNKYLQPFCFAKYQVIIPPKKQQSGEAFG